MPFIGCQAVAEEDIGAHTLEALRGSALASEKGPTGDYLEREVNL